MSIRINTTDVVDLEVAGINGYPAVGGHLLRFSIKASMVAVTKGHISLSNPWARVYCDSNRIYVGRAQAEAPIHIHSSSHKQDRHFMLELPLSAETLEGLERVRNGGDMQLTLDVYANMFNGIQDDDGYDKVAVTIDRGKWIAALEEMGYGTSIVFEVPITLSQAPTARAIGAALKSARGHLFDGNYRAAVSDCRIMLESSKPDTRELKTAREKWKEDKEQLTKRQRELILFSSLHDYTSLSHHVTADGHYQDYTRYEALMVLGTTLGVLSALVEKKVAAG